MRDRRRFGNRGVYQCQCCGRSTRQAGQLDHLCPECDELSGMENSVLDGVDTVEAMAPRRDELIAQAVKRGSDEAVLRKQFAILFGKAS